MPSYLHPGVYVEEIPSGSKPIEGVGTSTAAFIGYTTQGPIGEPELIFKWDDYDKQYGGIRDTKLTTGDPMGLSVSAFFQNGGTAAYIVRITKDWNGSAPSTNDKGAKAVAYLDNPEVTGTSGTENVLEFTAVNEGEWANGMVARMSVSTIDSSLYDVDIGWKNNDDEFSAEESYSNVSMDKTNAQFIKGVINDVSELVTVELIDVVGKSISSDNYLGTSTSGDLGGVALDFSAFLNPSRDLEISIDRNSVFTITLPDENYASLAKVAEAIQKKVRATGASGDDYLTKFTCEAVDNKLVLTSGTRNQDSSVVVTSDTGLAPTLKLGIDYYIGTSTSGDLSALSGVLDLTAVGSSGRSLSGTIDGTPFGPFDLGDINFVSLNDVATKLSGISGLSCEVVSNRLVLSTDTNTQTSSIVVTSDFGIAPTLGLGISPIHHGGAEINGQEYCDANCGAELTGQESADTASANESEDALEGGGNGKDPEQDDYKAVFTALMKYRDINIICLPGQAWGSIASEAIVADAISHAERMKSRMVIVDPPVSKELETQLDVTKLSLPNKTYSVLYYPWIKVSNRFYNAETNPGANQTVLVPPCGFAAGMWAKTDGRRGVWKAPAGLETGLLGAAGLQYVIEDGEQDQLNPLGVNCIRRVAGSGPVIWGARTLATKADPEWRYVPVRRTAIMIEQSIYNGIQWAVFEPNKHTLWASLRANIGSFMNGLFRAGTFQGEKSSDAYFVRCGLGDTMTQGEIDRGQVIVVVGFAPVKPAEFVIVRIQQKVGQE